SRRRHTRSKRDWSSDVCSSDLKRVPMQFEGVNQEIEKLAESITNEQGEEMHSLQNIEPYEIVNASYDADTNFLKEEGGLTHLIGVLTTKNQVSDLLDVVP